LILKLSSVDTCINAVILAGTLNLKSVLDYTDCRETILTASVKSVTLRKGSVELHHLRYGYDEEFSFYLFLKNVKTPLMVLTAMSNCP
jgi:hypothetical protein